jgi:hypothetical protein
VHESPDFIERYFPVSHARQDEAAVTALNFPGAQLEHQVEPWFVAYMPSAHEVQARHAACEYVPAGQEAQLAAASWAWKVPAAQGVHDVEAEAEA